MQREAKSSSLCSASYIAVNTTLLAFAAADIDRKAAAPAADAPCSNRSISPVCGAHSSKPAARRGCGARRGGQTDGHRIVTQPCRILCEQCQE